MDESWRLRDQIERATEPGPNCPDGLDPDMVPLRETWIEFGRLLQAADVDAAAAGAASRMRLEGALVAEPSILTTSELLRPAQPVEMASLPQTRRVWSAAAVFALAASLLVVASLVVPLEKPSAVTPPTDAQANAPTPEMAETPSEKVSREQAPVEQGWAWDEAIDSEINNLAQGAVTLEQEWFVGSSSAVDSDLYQLQQDLSNGTF